MHKTPIILTREICRNYIEQYLFEPRTGIEINTDHVGRIGLELEAFPYTINAEKRIQTVNFNKGNGSLVKALINSSAVYSGVARYSDHGNEQENPLPVAIEFPDNSNFQFEPGGQVEISTAPCNSLEDLEAQLKSRQNILSQLTTQNQFHFAQFGTNPWFTAEDIGLQTNKKRYQAMSRYFDSISPYGRQMMLQTCSLQVSIDAGLHADTRVKRIVTANLLAPFAIALLANSSVTAGKVNGYRSHRSFIWQQLDNTRTGILPIGNLKTPDTENLIDAYFEFALNAPVIFIEEFGDHVFPSAITLKHWINNPVKGLSPTIKHLQNHLSLLFPEVRLKGYLELRSPDAPPPAWQMIPVLFYTGLMYADNYLDKTLDLLLPFATQLPSLMQQATYGMQTDEIFSISKKLMQLSIEGLTALPEYFKSTKHVNLLSSFFEKFTVQRKTFADEYLEKFNQSKIFISG